MKLKEYQPKYKTLELMVNSVGEYMTCEQMYKMCKDIKLIRYNNAIKKYGDYGIASVKDFEDTKTTSVILKNWKYN